MSRPFGTRWARTQYLDRRTRECTPFVESVSTQLPMERSASGILISRGCFRGGWCRDGLACSRHLRLEAACCAKNGRISSGNLWVRTRPARAKTRPCPAQHQHHGVSLYSPVSAGLLTGTMTRRARRPSRRRRLASQSVQRSRAAAGAQFASGERWREIPRGHGRSQGEVAVEWDVAFSAVTGTMTGLPQGGACTRGYRNGRISPHVKREDANCRSPARFSRLFAPWSRRAGRKLLESG